MSVSRVVFAALLLALPWRPASAQSFPVNGDFAQSGTPPAGWFLDENTARKGSMTLRPPPSGTTGKMLILAPNDANTPSDKPYGVGQLLPANAFRGRDVTVSAILGSEGGANAVLGLAVLRKGGAGGTVMLRGDGPPGPQQDRLSVPNDNSVEGLILFLVAEGTKGEASFASVSVRPDTTPAAAPATAAPSGGPYAPAPDITATVRVDTTRILRTIPRGIFGTNVEVIRDANGLWDPRNQRLEPQIVGLASELHLGPIRFPGGVWSDAYDWHNGIGPRDQRATTPTLPGNDEKFRHNFGTDEVLQLAHALTAKWQLLQRAMMKAGDRTHGDGPVGRPDSQGPCDELPPRDRPGCARRCQLPGAARCRPGRFGSRRPSSAQFVPCNRISAGEQRRWWRAAVTGPGSGSPGAAARCG